MRGEQSPHRDHDLPKGAMCDHPLYCFDAAPSCYKSNAPRWEAALYRHHRWLDDEAERKASERQTASLAAIVVILLLLLGGLFLVQRLRAAAVIEDCLMSGRRNCDALVIGPGRHR
jgi:hypothetical protein